MRPQKNYGPCAVINCTNSNIRYRVITELAYKKCCEKQILKQYPYLSVGKQLCHPHYCSTFTLKMQALTKVLYCQQHQEHTNLELDPLKFKILIEAEPQLEVRLPNNPPVRPPVRPPNNLPARLPNNPPVRPPNNPPVRPPNNPPIRPSNNPP
ncbi:14475_t:CDS:2, partial [Cetraspora pellucida]